MVYKAYNVMKNSSGKQEGRKFIVGVSKKGESKSAFQSRVQQDNYSWNRKVGAKSGNKVALLEVKNSSSTKKVRSTTRKERNPFDFNMDFGF